VQYQVKVNPFSLQKFGLELGDIVEAVRSNNRNAGGQFIVLGSEEHLVRGIGLLQDLDGIRNLPVATVDNVPVRVQDVAGVSFGPEIRRGVVTRNGEREVVSGIVLKLFGENTSDVIDRLYQKVEQVKASLPEGVHLVPYYEQAHLVESATGTVKKALLQGAVLVFITLALFLGNLRTSLIVGLALPLCALTAIIFMRAFGVSANLMSLGGIAIAIGMLGDGAIVMVENIYRHLNISEKSHIEKSRVIHDAAREVGKPIVFSVLIIIVVFLPLFGLEGVEGKMFSPMAFTIAFALLGSAIMATVVAPVLSFFLLKKGKHREFWFLRWLKQAYRPLVSGAVAHRKTVAAVSMVLFAASMAVFPLIGTEFIPVLEEGSILTGVTMTPSIALEEATATVMKLERRIMGYEEVRETISRIGRPEAGSHPHPVNYAEIHIELKPMNEWTRYASKQEFIVALNRDLSALPGIQLSFTQPIQNAFDELLSGIKAQLAIKIFGEDLDVLQRKAEEVREAIEEVPGLADLAVEQSYGQPQIQVVADRESCSRYGVTVSSILEMVELAVGGEVIDSMYLNTRRYGIHLRYDEAFRGDPDAIRNLLIRNDQGVLIPLDQVAHVKQVVGPIQINREKNQRRWIVQANVRGRDLGSVVAEIQEHIEERVELPPGYFLEYGGQFENQQRAMRRLSIIVPIVLAVIFGLLWMSFGTLRHALVIVMNIPLALIGGVLGLYFSGEYLSVPASVGFIALFGIAVQNGVVMVSYFNLHRGHGDSLKEAVVTGAALRLRPVLMTACTTVFGLLPLLLSHGIGSEVQRPLAIVVVYGLTSSTLLTLFVLPSVYAWVEERVERRTRT
jgi:cobalt-zinc-cadmium resistance protein CzcA